MRQEIKFPPIPRWLWLISALCVALVIGYLDWITGVEKEFSIFFILPITMATWFVGRGWGYFSTIVCAAIWFAADTLPFNFKPIPFDTPSWNLIIRLGFFVIFALLLSRLHESMQREKQLARHDGLTGLANRNYFNEFASLELERSKRYQHPFAVAFMDIDNFKSLNDRMGHKTGDEALRLTACLIKENIRSSDMAARMGGDEFCIIFPEADIQNLKSIFIKLRTILDTAIRENQWHLTFSFGVALFKNPPKNIDAMIKVADSLMYKVKKKNKNGIEFRII